MRKFLYNIVSFSLIFFVSAMVMSTIADNGLKKSSKQEWKSWNDIFNHKINETIVILGSSRALGGYNPLIIENRLNLSCYNLGMNGYTIDLIKQRFQVLIKYNTKPKTVILNLDYTTTFEICNWPYQMSQYLPYMDEELFNNYFDRIAVSWAERHIPLYKYQTMIDKFFIGIQEFFSHEHETTGVYKGYVNNTVHFEGTKLQDILKDGKPIKVYADDDAILIFDEFIKSLTNNGINVILVLAPYYHVVSHNFDENKKKFDNAVNDVANKYNVNILDYTNYLSNDTIYFCNGTHLNRLGAKIFTEKLSEDLIYLFKK